MLELHRLFSSPETQFSDNYVRCELAPPTNHERVLSILCRIHNGIDPAEDQYPQNQELKHARARYQRYLEMGNHMPLLVEKMILRGIMRVRERLRVMPDPSRDPPSVQED